MSVVCLFLVGCASKTSLIEANSIEGWEEINDAEWSVENGILYGEKDARIAKHCILVSKQEYKDFKIKVEYLAINGNSGFYFRLQPENNPVGFKGFHADIDATGKHSGGLFDVGVKWMNKPEPKEVAKVFKLGDWNTMEIEAIGDQVDITLNGTKMTSLKSNRSSKGKLGIQLHSNENTKIKFKTIEITEL